MLFEVSGLNVYYDLIHVIKDVSFNVDEGEIVTLIGANGAGKTTTLRTLSGIKKQTSGSIKFMGEDIAATQPVYRVKKGISQVPEGRRVFVDMTVRENLDLGAFLRRDKDGIKRDFDMVFDCFPVLKERQKQPAGTLSGGEQQMLAMGRALMSNPKLLLMDEPSMGLSPLLVQEIFHIIKTVNDRGVTILLVEQNAGMALKVAHRAYVMETGSIVLSGTGAELMRSPEIKKAYLGG